MIQMDLVCTLQLQFLLVIYKTVPLERIAKLKEVEDNAKEKKEKLKTKFTLTVQLLADAYDR